MTDQHIDVEIGTQPDGQRNRSNERSPARSPAPRRRTARAVSELDGDGVDDRPDDFDSPLGVDDGLLNGNNHNTKGRPSPPSDDMLPNGRAPRPRPSFDDVFNTTGTVMVDGVETQLPDVNAYQHKKTLAQGMMDLALLSANANQLRYVVESYSRHPYFYPSIIFISMSIIFQVAVGVGLILNSRYNIRDEKDRCKANKINNYTIIGIFIVTVVNVFISSFGVADAPPQGNV